MKKPILTDYGLTEEQFEEYRRGKDTNARDFYFYFGLFTIWLSILVIICINTGWPEEGKFYQFS